LLIVSPPRVLKPHDFRALYFLWVHRFSKRIELIMVKYTMPAHKYQFFISFKIPLDKP
jgi:hypothetical protein